MTVHVKVVRIDKDLPLPKIEQAGDVCFDLRAAKSMTLFPDAKPVLVPTGIKVAIPANYEGLIRPRSGIAHKNWIIVTNAPGTIDQRYREQMFVSMFNNGFEPFKIEKGDRIAQFAIREVPHVILQEVEELDATDRGEGFGSSGVK